MGTESGYFLCQKRGRFLFLLVLVNLLSRSRPYVKHLSSWFSMVMVASMSIRSTKRINVRKQYEQICMLLNKKVVLLKNNGVFMCPFRLFLPYLNLKYSVFLLSSILLSFFPALFSPILMAFHILSLFCQGCQFIFLPSHTNNRQIFLC